MLAVLLLGLVPGLPAAAATSYTNVASGKVLDVSNCGSADGTNIQQWSWLNNTCQRFRLVHTTGGFVRLVNAATNVRLWTWLNNNCQQWSLNPVP